MRVDVGGVTPGGPVEDLEPCRADRDLLADPGELLPGRHPVEIKVGAKPQRVDGDAPLAVKVALLPKQIAVAELAAVTVGFGNTSNCNVCVLLQPIASAPTTV